MSLTSLIEDYAAARKATVEICKSLEIEDMCIQVAPEQSPIKWHMGHTTWFFDQLILKKFERAHKVFDESFYRIFNSYYKSLGKHWRQDERGLLSRPTVERILSYRDDIDNRLVELLKSAPQEIRKELYQLVLLGIQHEQQHQELMYMDIKLLMSCQEALEGVNLSLEKDLSCELKGEYLNFDGGIFEAGVDLGAQDFVYDNETPRHKVYLRPFAIKSTLETNADFLEFVESGAYDQPKLWLSDGANYLEMSGRRAPLYWKKEKDNWYERTLNGWRQLDPNRPVSHITFYEAAAYARFRKKRLPTEFEWEFAANSRLGKLKQLYSSLWQWTSSDYAPYPGHTWREDALGEYNSKFMINLKVLRGGCAYTPYGHTRLTYRNFYAPEKSWMFSGIRLAQ